MLSAAVSDRCPKPGGNNTGGMVPLVGTLGGGTGGPLVVITLDGEQLEAVVNMSSPPLLMGEM